MVGYIQRNIKKFSVVLWIIVAAFVGTIFLVWGRGSLMGIGGSYVAKVGDVEITIHDFQRAYSRLLDIYRNIYKEKFTPELAKKLGIKEQALSMLIDEAVVLNVALKEGLTVSPQEMADALSRVKAFQVNGRFDPQRYKEVLRLNGYSPVEFERELYDEILRKKLEVMVKASVDLYPAELELFTRGMLQKAKVDYFVADIGDFVNMVEVSPEEAKSFYEKHKDMFLTEPQLELEYVFVSPDSFYKKVLVTKEEIENYYKQNLDRFIDKDGKKKPLEKVKDVIVKELKKEKARKEALRYIIRLQREMQKSTFEKVCKREGLPIVKVKLSPVSKIDLPKKVIEKALNIEEDKPSPVIRTDKGFYVLVVTRRIPSRIPSFEEVQPEVVQRIKVQKAPQAAQEWAEKLIAENGTLKEIVKKKQLKYKVSTSDYFTRKEGLKIGKEVYKRVAFKALQLKLHQKGYALENGKLVVFEVVDFKEPTKEELKKEADKLKPYLLSTKREEVWAAFVREAKERTPVKLNQKVWEAFR